MAIKGTGLAAILAGQSTMAAQHRAHHHDGNIYERIKSGARASGLHIGLVVACMIYIYLGAIVFKHMEYPHEMEIREQTSSQFEELQRRFLREVEDVKDLIDVDDEQFNTTVDALIDKYVEDLFKSFENPIARNYFDSLFYNEGDYTNLWTMDSSVLFTATTMVPVGFGLITPLTWAGRIFLIVYAIVGLPLALVTISDIGKFFCDAIFKLFRESTTSFMVVILLLLVLYPVIGGLCIHNVSKLSLFDSVYYCCITILTVGFGDIDPPISVPYLILFIVVGVTLVTISVDVIAAEVIHQIHYMGRQMGKAKVIADKMMQMAQKINIQKGLGLGMAQLGAFARMGMMMNLTSNGGTVNREVNGNENEILTRKSTAYNPDIEFDLIDKLGPSASLYHFDYDAVEDENFYALRNS